jgi:hypothetical protein
MMDVQGATGGFLHEKDVKLAHKALISWNPLVHAPWMLLFPRFLWFSVFFTFCHFHCSMPEFPLSCCHPTSCLYYIYGVCQEEWWNTKILKDH